MSTKKTKDSMLVRALFGSSTKRNYLSSILYFICSLIFLSYFFIRAYEFLIKKSPLELGDVGLLQMQNFILTVSALAFACLILASFANTVSNIENFKRKVCSHKESIYSNINNSLYFMGGLSVVLASILILCRGLFDYHFGHISSGETKINVETFIMIFAGVSIFLAIMFSIASFIEPNLTVARKIIKNKDVSSQTDCGDYCEGNPKESNNKIVRTNSSTIVNAGFKHNTSDAENDTTTVDAKALGSASHQVKH